MHGVLGVALNRLDDGTDAARRLGGALGQALHFFRDHGEAASGLACRSSLNGSIQGEHIGLFGNLRDEFDDLADFLGRFTQALDTLRGLLDLLTNAVHAGDGVAHRVAALLCRFQR